MDLELLSEFFSFVLQSIFWYFIFALVFAFFRQNAENKNQEFKEQLGRISKLIHRVQVEKYGEVYYWFDADDNRFLGQGKTTEETVDQIRKRFPSHVFFVGDKDRAYRLSGPDWTLKPLDIVNLKT